MSLSMLTRERTGTQSKECWWDFVTQYAYKGENGNSIKRMLVGFCLKVRDTKSSGFLLTNT